MLQLVSLNGAQVTQSLYQPKEGPASIKKCLSYLKKVLGLDAEVSKFDASSSSFKILSDICKTHSFTNFQGDIYLPMQSLKGETWGFIKVKTKGKSIPAIRIKKAVSAIESIIRPNLPPAEEVYFQNQHSNLILNIALTDSYKLALKEYSNNGYSSFINLSEWCNSEQPLSLKDLRGFKNSLFYVSEVLDLTSSQRSSLALYSMLPASIRKSSLILCSKKTLSEIQNSLKKEQGFLSTFTEENQNLILNKKSTSQNEVL